MKSLRYALIAVFFIFIYNITGIIVISHLIDVVIIFFVVGFIGYVIEKKKYIELNKGELNPSINRSLAKKKSGLPNGLELIHELKKPQVRVLIGNFEESMNDIFSEVIKEVIKSKYDLKIRLSFYGEEIVELAENDAIDIFILIMNNIRFSGIDSVENRLINSLQLITQIKMTCGRPVIALSGWKEDSSLIARAKIAADFYLQMPCKIDAFIETFKKCLEMLPDFDEVP